ncbi:MAG: glutathione S-transferase N-terminal domain-containing protein [Polyangiaceae bacterium]|nr:glutathione S-transferase N-terminal domain-containing protein [Polyangiaceae bacterium]
MASSYWAAMHLYFSPTSPYARKVRAVLLEKGVAFDGIDVAATVHSPSAHNPLGKVPTLVLPDGTVLFDSTVITETIDALHPEPRLIPEAGLERARVRRWEALADGLCDVLVPVVLDGRRPVEHRDPEYTAKQEAKVRAVLAYTDYFVTGRRFLEGGSFTLADIALVCSLGYVELRRPDLLTGHQATQGFCARLLERPSLTARIPPNLPLRA